MAGTGLVKFVACTDSVGPKLLLTGVRGTAIESEVDRRRRDNLDACQLG